MHFRCPRSSFLDGARGADGEARPKAGAVPRGAPAPAACRLVRGEDVGRSSRVRLCSSAAALLAITSTCSPDEARHFAFNPQLRQEGSKISR